MSGMFTIAMRCGGARAEYLRAAVPIRRVA